MKESFFFSQLVLLLILVITVISPVSAKVASGVQHLGSRLHQSQALLEATAHLGSNVSSYYDALGSSLVTKGLPNSTVVCRGGACKAGSFTNGSGVTTDAAGKLSGVSTGIGDSVAAASKNIPHDKVGVTTVGNIRAAGNKVVNDRGNHANVSRITAEQAADLFKNVVKNPNK